MRSWVRRTRIARMSMSDIGTDFGAGEEGLSAALNELSKLTLELDSA
jgi:hypothetical protein